MKKPIGSQFSFSNLDGARASIDSEDRLSISSERQEVVEVDEEEGTVSFPAASPESHATGDRLVWINGQPALVPVTVDIATVYPEASIELKWPTHLQQENSGGSTESLDTSSDPSRDVTVEVTEFNQVKTHPRPLQRARSRYEARTGNTPWKNRHIGADHHLSDLSQGTQEQWEQQRVYHKCDRCNNQLTDTDWSKLKSEGWVFGIVKHCSPCIDSMARAPDQSTRPHELTDVE